MLTIFFEITFSTTSPEKEIIFNRPDKIFSYKVSLKDNIMLFLVLRSPNVNTTLHVL